MSEPGMRKGLNNPTKHRESAWNTSSKMISPVESSYGNTEMRQLLHLPGLYISLHHHIEPTTNFFLQQQLHQNDSFLQGKGMHMAFS